MDMPAVENMVFGGKRQWPNGFGGQKPSGRRGFWLWASLSRASQPAAGMLRPLRLAQSQNPQPQHHSQFSDRLYASHHITERAQIKVSESSPVRTWVRVPMYSSFMPTARLIG